MAAEKEYFQGWRERGGIRRCCSTAVHTEHKYGYRVILDIRLGYVSQRQRAVTDVVNFDTMHSPG